MSIAERYAALRAAVPAHVTIVAVSKFHPVEAIGEAIAAGVTDIGENYVQEARRKLCHPEVLPCHPEVLPCHPEVLPCHPEVSKDAELVEALARVKKHFIGHIQTNKAKAIVATFDVVQSVERADAAAALAKAADALGKRLPVLLQLNISPAERFGCAPAEAPRLAELVRSHASLDLQGVMAIGPITHDRGEIARAFELAARTFRSIGGTTLSLGMSDDWPLAVEAGSTMIRVGSTIFGPRPARPASKSPSTSSP